MEIEGQDAPTESITAMEPSQRVAVPNQRTFSTMRRAVRGLLKEGQNHLFENWPPSGEKTDDKLRFTEQVQELGAKYPGGLVAYLRKVKELLANVKGERRHDQSNGCTTFVAQGERLEFGSDKFVECEEVGVRGSCRAAFVLMAGGFAERLGLNGGIKDSSAVASISPSTGQLVLDSSDPFLIKTMPQGSGGIHGVLFDSGLLQKWQEEGRKWIVFFEEGNGLTFKGLPAFLGASVIRDWDVNLLAAPQKEQKSGPNAEENMDCIQSVLTAMGCGFVNINDFSSEHSPFPNGLDQVTIPALLFETSKVLHQILINCSL